ncbi:serine/threonine protein phosphatase [Babesia caballi]|uniref:Serine/threonine protein phosphatase n=1 Tax=Babesia caballi TaxID=5871 RepID=A0AAV4M5P5_BABCB|nr:serine/threonine protein phosphatase [Babesia caballi]
MLVKSVGNPRKVRGGEGCRLAKCGAIGACKRGEVGAAFLTAAAIIFSFVHDAKKTPEIGGRLGMGMRTLFTRNRLMLDLLNWITCLPIVTVPNHAVYCTAKLHDGVLEIFEDNQAGARWMISGFE